MSLFDLNAKPPGGPRFLGPPIRPGAAGLGAGSWQMGAGNRPDILSPNSNLPSPGIGMPENQPLTWVGDRGVQPAGWPQQSGGNNPNLPSPNSQLPTGIPSWNQLNIPTELQQLIARRAGMGGGPVRQGFVRPGMFPQPAPQPGSETMPWSAMNLPPWLQQMIAQRMGNAQQPVAVPPIG